MNTQQLGTDIAGDVSFVMNNVTITQTYQFKANVVRTGTGQYVVTIAAGEGIDMDHAEIDIYHGADIGETAAIGLLWDVTELTPGAAGEAQFQVNFFKPVYSAAGGGTIVCTPTDVKRGSITIRRKVPSVN
jgi:hypothetical protein